MSDLESFGVKEIDELLGGGILPGANYLIEFEQGTVELAFVAAYLNEAIRKVELTAVAVLDLPYFYVLKDLEKFGFNATEALNSGSLVVSELREEGRPSCSATGPVHTVGDLTNLSEFLDHFNGIAEAIERKQTDGEFTRSRSALISLSTPIMTLKFNDAYKLVRAWVSTSKEKSMFGLALLNSEMFGKTVVSAMENLNDGVIVLTSKDIDGKFQRFIRVKKSPLTNFCSEEVPYDIIGNKPSFSSSFASPPVLGRSFMHETTLDNVSRIIISELDKDGRRKYDELGKSVGYTGTAIKKRVRSLLKRDVIKVSALLNVAKMNMRLAITMIEVASAEDLNLLVNRLKNCPRVLHMLTTLGGYNVIVLSVAEDTDTLQSFSLQQFSLRGNKGIKRADFYPIANLCDSPHFVMGKYLMKTGGNTAPCRSNCRTCQRYHDNKCVGCPATRWYRGHVKQES